MTLTHPSSRADTGTTPAAGHPRTRRPRPGRTLALRVFLAILTVAVVVAGMSALAHHLDESTHPAQEWP